MMIGPTVVAFGSSMPDLVVCDTSTPAGGSLLLRLMVPLIRSHTLPRFAGALLILAYVAYIAYLVLTTLH